MKKTLKFITLSLTFIFLITLYGCQKDTTDHYDAIIKRGYVIVGLDDTFRPMGFRDENDNIVGFDVDLAKATFAKMGLDVRFQPIDWQMKETELNNGTIDFIWNGYTITEDRSQKVAFSQPYLENQQVIVVLANSSIQTKADLSDKEVAVQTASSSYDALTSDTDFLNNIKNGTPTLYDTNEEALSDLKVGRVDAVVVDEILARYDIQSNNETSFRILEDNMGTEQYGVGMRLTDTQLITAFNIAFQSIIDNNEASTISINWFGEDIIIK